MKKRTLFGVIMASALMMSSSWAYVIDDPDAELLNINGTVVGQVDEFIVFGDLSKYNEGTETDWVNAYFAGINSGTIVELGVKTEGDIPYYNTDGTTYTRDDSGTIVASGGIFAFGTIAPTDYFTIKQGDYIALFGNNDSLDWGVFDTNLFEFPNLPTENYTISHYTTFSTVGTTTIAEPGTLGLLGLGLLGAGIIKRKQQ